MLTRTEKRIFLLIVCLLAIGLLTRYVPRFFVQEFEGSQNKEILLKAKNTPVPLVDSTKSDSLKKQLEPITKIRKPPNKPLKIDINFADKTQLMSLSGVGPVLAQAIISHREKNGAFKNTGDLIAVKGIGPKKLQKIKPFVVINHGK